MGGWEGGDHPLPLHPDVHLVYFFYTSFHHVLNSGFRRILVFLTCRKIYKSPGVTMLLCQCRPENPPTRRSQTSYFVVCEVWSVHTELNKTIIPARDPQLCFRGAFIFPDRIREWGLNEKTKSKLTNFMEDEGGELLLPSPPDASSVFLAFC